MACTCGDKGALVKSFVYPFISWKPLDGVEELIATWGPQLSVIERMHVSLGTRGRVALVITGKDREGKNVVKKTLLGRISIELDCR